MRGFVVAVTLLALAHAPLADAKDFARLVAVGADGRSLDLRAESRVIRSLFWHPASVYEIRPPAARPRGGFVRLYPLGRGGFPAHSGRFYAAADAVCFASARPPKCFRPNRAVLALLGPARRLRRFHRPAAGVASLQPGNGDLNLRTGLELALDRFRLAVPSARPARCVAFRATWRAGNPWKRPGRFCVSSRGVYARGKLYPASRSVWWLARVSSR